ARTTVAASSTIPENIFIYLVLWVNIARRRRVFLMGGGRTMVRPYIDFFLGGRFEKRPYFFWGGGRTMVRPYIEVFSGRTL
ncbi:MAG: hypothetical protein K2L99_00200, partial [Muribaculaceae bacterium]|nr:hypothetical protein [Muribaculaceae bacterium]